MTELLSNTPLKGRRVLVSGSLHKSCSVDLARYAHAFIEKLTTGLIKLGATFVVPIDCEPQLRGDPNLPSATFDWTVFETIWENRNVYRSDLPGSYLAHAVLHGKTAMQIPNKRAELWRAAQRESGFLDLSNLGTWNAGALRREEQAHVADLLIPLGGAEGVTHLANLFLEAGKPVIPLDLPVAVEGQGALGLRQLADRQPTRFFRSVEGTSEATLLNLTSMRNLPPVDEGVENVLNLIRNLVGQQAFFVRMLDRQHDEYDAVEVNFKRVVEPVVRSAGYNPITISRGPVERPFINTEIFEKLHRSQLVVADLTGLKPNCFLELGYAFGNRQPTLVLAKEGTHFPFDMVPYSTHFWQPDIQHEDAREALLAHWRQHAARQPLVAPAWLV